MKIEIGTAAPSTITFAPPPTKCRAWVKAKGIVYYCAQSFDHAGIHRDPAGEVEWGCHSVNYVGR